MCTVASTALELARWQFALTTLFHFVFVPLTLGLAPLLAVMQTLWRRSGDERWLRLTRFFDMLNARLKGRDFIAIDRYSFADITALVCVDFAKWVKHEPKPEHADLLRWHAAASARPSAKA